MQKITNEALGRIDVATFKQTEKRPVTIVLDNVRSMHNVGSVFRTADAFLINEIILCGITATPPHREITKTALGATQSVSWQYVPHTMQAIDLLKKQGYTIACIEQVDKSIYLQKFQAKAYEKIAFVFGNETDGVSQDIVQCCDLALEIPQFGTKHSFNISVTVGIVLWQLFCTK